MTADSPETSVCTARPSPGVSDRAERSDTLDGLRGCAVLLILVHHYVSLHPALREAPLGSPLSYLHAALGLTFTGVDLFFVLSGFLIGGILLDHRTSPKLLPAFYARRAFRILPLAWLNIGLVLGLYVSGRLGPHETPVLWWVYFTFLTNFDMALHGGWTFGLLAPHWSLAIEEQFYLAFPFVVRAWPVTRLLWLGPILVFGALVIRLGVWWRWPGNLFATHVLPFCRLDALAAGFTCACLVRGASWAAWHQRHRAKLWLSLFASGTALAVLLKAHAGEGHPMLATWGYTSVALFYATLLLLVYQPNEPWLRALFSVRILTLYGRYSYFIYLFQGLLALHLVSLLFHGQWSAVQRPTPWEIAAIPLLLLIPAALSWKFLETPLLRLGRRLPYA